MQGVGWHCDGYKLVIDQHKIIKLMHSPFLLSKFLRRFLLLIYCISSQLFNHDTTPSLHQVACILSPYTSQLVSSTKLVRRVEWSKACARTSSRYFDLQYLSLVVLLAYVVMFYTDICFLLVVLACRRKYSKSIRERFFVSSSSRFFYSNYHDRY